MKGYTPADEEDEPWNPRKLLLRAHEEEVGRTFHRKMDQVLGQADIYLFDAHASIKETHWHNAIQSYSAAYRSIAELQSMLETTINQLIEYKAKGVYDKPFRPSL